VPVRKPVAANRIAALVEASGRIRPEALEEALLRQEQWGGRLTRVLPEMGLIDEASLTALLAQGLKVPHVPLRGVRPDARTLSRVDADYALEHGLFPVELRDGARTLVLAMVDPTNLAVADAVARQGGVRVAIAIAGEQELAAAQARVWPGARGLDVFSGVADGRVDVDEDPDAEDTGFKVVDASGRTLARSVDALMELEPPPPPPPARGQLGSTPGLDLSRASSLLDDLLGGPGTPAPEGLTTEQLRRLEALRANQEKSSRILRALLELSAEKGLVQMAELAQRMRGS